MQDASTLPKGKSLEVPTDGRPLNMPGIYKHKDTGATFITAPLTEKGEGVIQADFLMNPVWQGAWERVGDVPSGKELLALRKLQEKKDIVNDAVTKKAEEAEVAEIMARYEKEEADKAGVKIEKSDLKPQPAVTLPEGGENYEPSILKTLN